MDNKTLARCLSSSASEALSAEFFRSKPNIPGLIAVIVFYAFMLVVGIVASWWGNRKSKQQNNAKSEDAMLAGRNIGLFVGIFTMTATWVGGGYINGTAESVFKPDSGLAMTQAPVAYSISLILGGIFFAKKMREAGYVTMLDPFRQRYGRVMAALLYIPALLGDIFYASAILTALGASLSVIIGINTVWAIILSALIAIFYTFIGGLFSVVYTDVIQLSFIFIGLWLVIPFAMLHPAVTSITETANQGWLGEAPSGYGIISYVDTALLMVLGGMPWQAYYQRVLSQKTSRGAVILSIIAGINCMIMSIPPVLIGAIAVSTDWNATDYREFGPIPVPACDYPLILPIVIQFLTPVPVAVIGLGALSAAVMSSADSSVLAASSMFARNVYKPLRDAASSVCCKGHQVSEREVVWVMRLSVIVVGVLATVMAITVRSVYGLWYMSSDFVYVVLFPQLVCVVYLPFANAYGAMAGYFVGWILRLLGGEMLLGLEPVITGHWFQLIPFKTLTMIISLLTIVVLSSLSSICCPRLPRLDRALLGVWSEKHEPRSYDLTTKHDNLACEGDVSLKYRRKEDDNENSVYF